MTAKLSQHQELILADLKCGHTLSLNTRTYCYYVLNEDMSGEKVHYSTAQSIIARGIVKASGSDANWLHYKLF